jgi:hypothetical protein
VYLSSVISRGDESTREKEFTSWLCVRAIISTWTRIGDFAPFFYNQICSGLILVSRLDTIIRSNVNF